jgi:hypothetical protein
LSVTPPTAGVATPPATPSNGPIAITGARLAELVVTGCALLTAGVITVVLARRRGRGVQR